MADTIIAQKDMDRIIRMIGSGHYFNDLKVLQMAIDKKGPVSQDFFGENCCYETWGYKWRGKPELRAIRQEVISAITEVIIGENYKPYKQKMDADHYARYFHALAILKVNKDSIGKTKNDFMRNAFLEFWRFDDGSDEIWKILDEAAWSIAEAIKGIKGLPVRESIYPDE